MFKTQKAGIPQIFTKPHNPPDLSSLKVIELQTIKQFVKNKALETCLEFLLLLKNYISPARENSQVRNIKHNRMYFNERINPMKERKY